MFTKESCQARDLSPIEIVGGQHNFDKGKSQTLNIDIHDIDIDDIDWDISENSTLTGTFQRTALTRIGHAIFKFHSFHKFEENKHPKNDFDNPLKRYE